MLFVTLCTLPQCPWIVLPVGNAAVWAGWDLETVNILVTSLFVECLAYLSLLHAAHGIPGCRTSYPLTVLCWNDSVKQKSGALFTSSIRWCNKHFESTSGWSTTFQKSNGGGSSRIAHVVLEETERRKEDEGFLRGAHQEPPVPLCIFSVYRVSVYWHTVVMENLTWRFSVYLKKCPFKPQAITSKFAKLLPYQFQKLPFAPSGVP